MLPPVGRMPLGAALGATGAAGFAAGAAIAFVGFPLDTLRVRWVARQPLCIPRTALLGLPAACLRVGLFNLLFFSCRHELATATARVDRLLIWKHIFPSAHAS